ncbi:hypothetical protein [Kitasatospora sp. NPDC088351]|uniref:hypothetical protein n=1 Tax=unclassified Kitasatospora TaxID=2633591 RepID=UPI0034313D6D
MRELHTLPSRPGTSVRRRWTAHRRGALLAMLGGAAVLAACSSSSTNPSIGASGPETPSTLSTAPNPSAFSGEPPSALASTVESALASASAARASSSAAAASFEASVAAQGAQANAKAASVLSGVEDGGNALGAVTLTGLPRASTGGLHAVVVTIANTGTSAASFAVQVDFTDTSGKTVDSAIVGADDVPAGGKASPVAFSTQPADVTLLPVVVKAVRY